MAANEPLQCDMCGFPVSDSYEQGYESGPTCRCMLGAPQATTHITTSGAAIVTGICSCGHPHWRVRVHGEPAWVCPICDLPNLNGVTVMGEGGEVPVSAPPATDPHHSSCGLCGGNQWHIYVDGRSAGLVCSNCGPMGHSEIEIPGISATRTGRISANPIAAENVGRSILAERAGRVSLPSLSSRLGELLERDFTEESMPISAQPKRHGSVLFPYKPLTRGKRKIKIEDTPEPQESIDYSFTVDISQDPDGGVWLRVTQGKYVKTYVDTTLKKVMKKMYDDMDDWLLEIIPF